MGKGAERSDKKTLGMILFGKKDKVLRTHELPDEVCEHCGEKGGVVSLFQIYYQVAFIPFVPLARRTASQCYCCRKVKMEKSFSNQQLEVSTYLKREVKTPFWTLIGASLIFIYIISNLLLKIS